MPLKLPSRNLTLSLAVILATALVVLYMAYPRTRPDPSLPLAEAFCKKLETAFNEKNVGEFLSALDDRQFVEAASAGLDVSGPIRARFKADQVFRTVAYKMFPPNDYFENVRFLRLHRSPTQLRATFRFVYVPNEPLYYDFILSTSREGNVQIIDIDNITFNSLCSNYLKEAFEFQQIKQIAPETARPQLDQAVSQLKDAFKNGDPTRVNEIYQSLPANIQSLSTLQVLNLRSALSLDPDTALAALEPFQKAHESKLAGNLALLQIHRLRGQWNEALLLLDKISPSLNDDPFLTVYRIEAYLALNNYPAAQAAGESALQADPTLKSIHLALIDAAFQYKQWDSAITLITRASKAAKLDTATIEALPHYPDFAQSPAHPKLPRHPN